MSKYSKIFIHKVFVSMIMNTYLTVPDLKTLSSIIVLGEAEQITPGKVLVYNNYVLQA